MAYTTLISTGDLQKHLHDPAWLVVDCRFNLAAPAEGAVAYEAGHIAGAVFADLDKDLSGPIIRGVTGRHPLPDVEVAAATFSRLGIDRTTQVVAYDDRGGMTASRLWWMLRWLGYDGVAVLDGGWQRWRDEGRETRGGIETRPAKHFEPQPRPQLVMDADAVQQRLNDPALTLVDARTADRYRGENETIDPVAGHIPGAVSSPYPDNLGADGLFLPADELRNKFHESVGEVEAGSVVFYCGSGVSAAHNVLAYAHAGLGDAMLYPGSWSEWITDPQHPLATGPQP